MKKRGKKAGILGEVCAQIVRVVERVSPELVNSVKLRLSAVQDLVLLRKCLIVISQMEHTRCDQLADWVLFVLHVIFKSYPPYKQTLSHRVWCSLECGVMDDSFHVNFSDEGNYSAADSLPESDQNDDDNESYHTATTEPVSCDGSW